jgi:ribosomal protein S18 acetylase RimI-like enzyme
LTAARATGRYGLPGKAIQTGEARHKSGDDFSICHFVNSVMLIATTVSTENELQQILDLQKKYLLSNIDSDEMKSQGFLTVQHTPELLKIMHSLAPSIVVKDGDAVVAYALVMLRECRELIPELIPMFNTFDHLEYHSLQHQGKPLMEYSFYVMGQICVAKEYRGQGLFDMLYRQHREVYRPEFDFIVTEVATRNARSMRAHERVGFKTIHTYTDELDHWAVVLWDWNQ